MIATALGEDSNVAAALSYLGAVDSKLSDVIDEASVSNFDE